MKSISLTDFVSKIGIGTNGRYLSYKTAYSSDYKAYLWHTENAKKYEKRVLSMCDEHGWLRDHSSGRNSEVLHIEVDENMTMRDAVSLYRERCQYIIDWISCDIGFEPKLIDSGAYDNKIESTIEYKIDVAITISTRIRPYIHRQCKRNIVNIAISDNEP